jgi:hypothetical protein
MNLAADEAENLAPLQDRIQVGDLRARDVGCSRGREFEAPVEGSSSAGALEASRRSRAPLALHSRQVFRVASGNSATGFASPHRRQTFVVGDSGVDLLVRFLTIPGDGRI